MIVWRFSRHESLDGRGGLLASARWHTRGREIVYCSPNPATAVLEILVHAQVREPSAFVGYRFLKLEIPDGLSRFEVNEAQLPPDWSTRVPLTRSWGDRWLTDGVTGLMFVRSALVPETMNILINPRHSEASQIKKLASFPYPLDARVLRGR